MLTTRDGLLIPFSLLWGGFAFFWEAQVLATSAPFPFALFGIPFVVTGIYMIAGRFLADAWLRTHIYYAVTDRRVLIVRVGPWPTFKALSLDRLPELILDQGTQGRGTIRFGQPPLIWGKGAYQQASSLTPALDPTPQFLAIEDANRVFAMIQDRGQGRPLLGAEVVERERGSSHAPGHR